MSTAVTPFLGFGPEVAGAARQSRQFVPTLVTLDKSFDMWSPTASAVQFALKANKQSDDNARQTVCTKSWPYYEASCLHGGRQADGRAQVVPIISADRTASHAHAAETIEH